MLNFVKLQNNSGEKNPQGGGCRGEGETDFPLSLHLLLVLHGRPAACRRHRRRRPSARKREARRQAEKTIRGREAQKSLGKQRCTARRVDGCGRAKRGRNSALGERGQERVSPRAQRSNAKRSARRYPREGERGRCARDARRPSPPAGGNQRGGIDRARKGASPSA